MRFLALSSLFFFVFFVVVVVVFPFCLTLFCFFYHIFTWNTSFLWPHVLGVILYMLMTFYSTECEAGSEVETLGFCYGRPGVCTGGPKMAGCSLLFVFLFFFGLFLYLCCAFLTKIGLFFNPTETCWCWGFYFCLSKSSYLRYLLPLLCLHTPLSSLLICILIRLHLMLGLRRLHFCECLFCKNDQWCWVCGRTESFNPPLPAAKHSGLLAQRKRTH